MTSAFAAGPLYGCLLLTILYAVKFDGWRMPKLPGLADFAAMIALEFLAAATSAYLPIGAIVAAAATIAVLGLWLDAVLFRVFTIELGPSGIGTAVTSALYRELTEMQSARRFFKAHPAFALLPLAAILLHGERLFAPAPSSAITALLAIYALWACIALSTIRSVMLPLLAAWLLTRVVSGGWAISCLGASLLWVVALSGRHPRSRLIHSFFGRRNLPKLPRSAPEQPSLEQFQPRLPPRSPMHGLLQAQDVLFWTVESMARDYLASFRPGTARTPFIDRLLESGVRCPQHFALSPLTNNAHVILYASSYTENGGFSPIQALRDAGYQTLYLTSCDTRSYGLRRLLERAGFDRIIDSGVLRNGSRDAISDADLVARAWEILAPSLRAGRRWFLHVHTHNTHVPYRLSDPAGFRHFDSSTDLGRFLNGLEEADSHLEKFVARLAAVKRDPPVLVVSADHGQSFGQFGYHSHGSAVVKEQVMVPCLFSHPRLEPRTISYSSHLDVLPTVLDLLGVEPGRPTFGASVLATRPPPAWLLWAGHPSRGRTSHFGLVKDQKKYMLDWTVNRAYELGWNDQGVRELIGEEKAYYGGLISNIAASLGVE